MSKTNKAALVVGLVGLILLLYIVLPKKDICADAVRGYKERANVSVDIIRSGYDSLKGALGTESVLEVPQIEKLDALKLSVLHACDTQCQLLSQCLRFVFFKPPSDACPGEYRDLKATQERAEGVLERLSAAGEQLKAAQTQVPAIQKARSDVQELQQASGATGTRLAQAQAKQLQLQTALATDLSRLSAELSELEAAK